MCITCLDCGAKLTRKTAQARWPIRCPSCSKKRARAKERERVSLQPKQSRKRREPAFPATCQRCGQHFLAKAPHARWCSPRCKPKPTYDRKCGYCGVSFVASRKPQKFCSPACGHAASGAKAEATCANPACRVVFLRTASRMRPNGCCSRSCQRALQKSRRPLCHNPWCGKRLARRLKGKTGAALGRDYMKYCGRDCYYDHRYGSDRPRKKSSDSVVAAASAHSLGTSLRKKCKNLNVPFDPECTRVAVCERDGWVCQLCGVHCLEKWSYKKGTRTPDERSAEHDHIIALTIPGNPGNVFPNSQCLCRSCNSKKSASACGQLRLDLEGSVQRWESEARRKRQQSSRCLEVIPAAAV